MKTLGAGDRKPRDYYFATNLSNRAVDKVSMPPKIEKKKTRICTLPKK
jgi:hypothetical protein